MFSNQIGAPSLSIWEAEKELIRRAKEGESQAFGELYDHYSPQIYRFIFLKVGDKEETEDLTHQVFLKAYENMPAYENQGFPFSSWLYRIARNKVTDHYRTKKSNIPLESANPEIFIGTASASDMLDGVLESERVMKAVGTLKPEYQDVVIMRFVEGLSLKETADNMDKSVGAIKLIQYRAMQELKEKLG